MKKRVYITGALLNNVVKGLFGNSSCIYLQGFSPSNKP